MLQADKGGWVEPLNPEQQQLADDELHDQEGLPGAFPGAGGPAALSDIDCVINGEYTVACRRDAADEVFLPFSFIEKYFEVSIFVSFIFDDSSYLYLFFTISSLLLSPTYPRSFYFPSTLSLSFL